MEITNQQENKVVLSVKVKTWGNISSIPDKALSAHIYPPDSDMADGYVREIELNGAIDERSDRIFVVNEHSVPGRLDLKQGFTHRYEAEEYAEKKMKIGEIFFPILKTEGQLRYRRMVSGTVRRRILSLPLLDAAEYLKKKAAELAKLNTAPVQPATMNVTLDLV